MTGISFALNKEYRGTITARLYRINPISGDTSYISQVSGVVDTTGKATLDLKPTAGDQAYFVSMSPDYPDDYPRWIKVPDKSTPIPIDSCVRAEPTNLNAGLSTPKKNDSNTLPRLKYTHGTRNGVDYTLITLFNAALNPGVVKKVLAGGAKTSPVSSFESALEASARTGYSVVVNASGFYADTGILNGLQILNGVGLQDFEVSYATEAVGFRSDGSMKIYRYPEWNLASMLKDGVWNAFSFRQALIMEGVKNSATTTSVQLSARHVLGWTGNDLKLLIVEGVTGVRGISIIGARDLAYDLGFENAINLGGGGDTQTVINGHHLNPSSDNNGRKVADFICFDVPFTGSVETRWVEPTLASGVVQHTVPAKIRLVDGIVQAQGAFKNDSQASGSNVAAFTLPWWAKPKAFQRVPVAMGTNAAFIDVATGGAVTRYVETQGAAVTYINPLSGYSVD